MGLSRWRRVAMLCFLFEVTGNRDAHPLADIVLMLLAVLPCQQLPNTCCTSGLGQLTR